MSAPRIYRARELVLGVDGGGTRTRAIITDTTDAILGEGTAGPSNPLRVGVSQAVASIREAVDRACDAAKVQRALIVAAEVGLAGVRREDLRASMREALKVIGIGEIEVVTDSDIALYGATDGEPGLVIIAGTGSICCGRGQRGKHVCAGGWGPVVGDEGSGSWIARRALQAVAQASDGRGPATSLCRAACAYFNVPVVEDLSMALYVPSMTNDRIAGFARQVIEAAQAGDTVAQEIMDGAGQQLGIAANTVIRKLRLEQEKFQVAYVGGIFNAGSLILDPLRAEIRRTAPKAYLSKPRMSPVIAAARMARRRFESLALAV